MGLVEDLDQSGAALDVWGNKVTSAQAQITSLISYLITLGRDTPAGGVLGTTAQGTFGATGASSAGGALLATTGGKLAYPLNALGSMLLALQSAGGLGDPGLLAKLSDAFNAQLGIGEAASGTNAVRIRRNKVGVALETEADLIDFFTEMVRRNQATPFIEALRHALEG